MKRVKGLAHLIHDTVEKVTDLVEETHQAAAAKTTRMLGPLPAVGEVARAVHAMQRPIAGGVYESIRLTNRLVQGVLELGLRVVPKELDAGPTDPWLDLTQASLNAAFGDFLEARGNPLAIPMSVMHRGEPLPLERASLERAWPDATERLCVFVHGLGCTEREWRWGAAETWGDRDTCYGSLLARDLGFTPVYVRYNTGLHISDNGQRLAALLDDLLAANPCEVKQLVLVGHSMGGLVSRSAVHYGHRAGRRWIDPLTHVFCLGSPHHGAPLERASNMLASVLSWFDTAATQVPAKLLRARSAGIKDLRFGNIVEEDWRDHDPDGLDDHRTDACMVESVAYYFISGCITSSPEHPLGELLGDVLVSLPSAAGHHHQPLRRIPFHGGETLAGVHHMALVNHPRVYETLRRALDEEQRDVAE
ncbi:MAG: esterase/lipase family protein [Myxococcota bacterium]